MKKVMLLFLGLMLFTAGCASYYGIMTESQSGADLKNYQSISVGWLDLGVDRWTKYDFDSQAKWVAMIDHMNKTALPDYFKRLITTKTINFASSFNEAPKGGGLVIKFTNVEYMQRTSTAAKVMFGAFAGSDTLDMTVHFIDGKTGKELDQVRISVYSKSAVDVAGWGFEGRVNNCVYNLAYYISGKVQ